MKMIRNLGATVVLVAAIGGAARGQETTRVSVDSSGAEGNGDSGYDGLDNEDLSISPDGRYVAFESVATNFASGDTNGVRDVFVHDRQSGSTERVSVDSGGMQGNSESANPSTSVDGRYIAFASAATNLVGGDTNGFWDVFVHDRSYGTTERVSVDSSGGQGNHHSGSDHGFNDDDISISATGRYVAFDSSATNLVSGDTNGVRDVFVHDRQSGSTERVSISSGGTQADGDSVDPSISATGRYVAFYSLATNLVGGDANGAGDIFVHDLQSGTTERVSVDSSGAQGNGSSFAPSISTDGRYVAFPSFATNLVSGDTNGVRDVFVHDRQSGSTERVSVGAGGEQGNGYSSIPSISADGRYVAFDSSATNLISGDTNGVRDVFVHDRQSGITERVSVNSGGAQGNGENASSSISADGRCVAFMSAATNLVGGDTNDVRDVFVRDRSTGIGWKYCTANANSTGAPADLSASGSANSSAGDLMLTSSPVPNQNGIFFHGMNQSQNPFGNGFMCTTGGIVRGAVVMGAGNVATYTYDNSDAKHTLAAFVGNTRNFQHWFRDPAAGGAFFNLSNALSIAVSP